MIRFKANNVDPILNSISCSGIYANFPAWNSEKSHPRKCRTLLVFLCNYSFITAPVWRQENHRVRRSRWISSPLFQGHRMCPSERQSNMTAIYTRWVRWKVLGLSLRPRSPKRMGKEDRQSRKKACKFLYSGLSRMLSCAGVHAAVQMCVCVCVCVCVCRVTAEAQTHTHTHTVTNTAARGLWCSRCCICCACLSSQIISSTGSKTWKQRQTTYSKVSNDTSGVSCSLDYRDMEAASVS